MVCQEKKNSNKAMKGYGSAARPIQVSSANSLPKPVKLSATSFIKIRKSNGPKTDPWDTPAFNSPVLGVASVITTRCFCLER